MAVVAALLLTVPLVGPAASVSASPAWSPADADRPLPSGGTGPLLDDVDRRLQARQAADLPGPVRGSLADQRDLVDDAARYRRALDGAAWADASADAVDPATAIEHLADRHGVELTDADHRQIERLDDLPADTHRALARLLGAYLTFEDAARAAYGDLAPGERSGPDEVAAEIRADPGSAGAVLDAVDAQTPTAAERDRVWTAKLRMADAARDLAEAASDTPVDVRIDVCPAVAIYVTGEGRTYEEDCVLVVDDGGNDTYRNNAGGTRLRDNNDEDCSSVNLLQLAEPAAALVDLGGHDVYGNSSAPRLCGANGGGWFGAGFLLDAGGDDLYVARGGGANGAGYYGQGFLADLGGDDTYEGGDAGLSQGGGFAGRGTLVDAGGDDRYNGTGLGTNGATVAGVGLLVDAAGNDTYLGGAITNGGALGGPALLLDGLGNDRYVGAAEAVNGGGFVGSGALVDGAGDDLYEGTRSAVNGGAIFGTGLLVDRGGDDRYVATFNGVNGGASIGAAALVDGNGTDVYRDDAGGNGTDRTVVPKGAVGAQVDLVHTPSQPPEEDEPESPTDGSDARPHVLVGVPDTGINPYHDVYSRPDLTEHPCTYIPGFPCDVQALNLSLDVDDYEQAVQADQDVWDSVEPGEWYWIPETSIVAVACEPDVASDHCILGGASHGTGTTSSVLSENPDALIAFKQGGSGTQMFRDRGIPVDVYSVSWGFIAPIPAPTGTCDEVFSFTDTAGIYVNSAGNDPRSTLADCWAGQPNVISVGGAFLAPRQEKGTASKQPEVVSYYCRPTAEEDSTSAMRGSYCGTSFAAPTVAGGLSKVILEIRQASGYTGTVQDGVVDPIADVTVADLRNAMNRTASYDPTPKYTHSGSTSDPPLNPVAPWLQWGWGFYDGWVANATADHLIGTDTADPKPPAARAYMTGQHAAKWALYADRV